ncbi:MAG: hypothetical protein CFE23_05920 [Flavobacterium sp. BFFFF1]|uniref:hypothetical protein n=1 Tax=Flavobacterium sp. BFFFF1 TaxID=2015557 RepID=UPI000BD0AF78|nr:hypothetical protein [Flavobacterium sp. BFFFF1]OYU81030.1 MAG: hypothetical protein CFE23_05920 [Flavobacterium sp. BFFFF1]
MARINAKGHLSGAVGPVYFRILNGKPIVQSKPGKGNVKQAAATKAGASEFGAASKTAKCIRAALFPILQDLADVTMFQRFTAAVYAAVRANTTVTKGNRRLADGDLSLLEGFEFNHNSPFAKYSSLSPQITCLPDGKLAISLADTASAEAFKIPHPKASGTELRVMVTVVDPHSGMFVNDERFSVSISGSSTVVPAQAWTTAILPAGHLVFVTMALRYYREDRSAGNIPLNSRELHPCRMVRAFLTGE